MLMGQLLRQLQDRRFATEILFGLGDVTLAARAEEAGAAEDETAGDYAANACARFADQADDEDWLALMTALERGSDPAATCLRAMVEWALKADAAPPPASHGCGCGGHGGCGGEGHGAGG